MTASPELIFDDLWRHEHFVRATLTSLLSDPNQVDDLAQETWLRALRQRPARVADPRAWLGAVARNLARTSWRADAHRRERETAKAAAASAEPPHAELEERQRVVAAVLALDEPYRTVVVLRYEHDLSTRAIAERQGASEATVRSQVSRAHEQLRKKLDRDFGGRERWAALALPAATARSAGALAWSIPAAAALLAGTSAWLWVRPQGSPVIEPVIAQAPATRPAADESVLQPARAPRANVAAIGGPAASDERAAVVVEEQLRPSVTLLDRGHYDDYERATFSFLWGLRDDPGLAYTRNDWDLCFSGGRFQADIVVDDHAVLADLGRLEARELGRLRPEQARFHDRPLQVRAGHAYYVGTRDTDQDLASFVLVREHGVGRSCTFDWYTTDGSGRAQGSLSDPGDGRPWVAVLEDLRRAQRAGRWLERPSVRLQVRSGDSNGNPNRIDLGGEVSGYVDEVVDRPLDLDSPTTRREPARAYGDGGWIPEDRTFVVTRIDYRARDGGESDHGWGRFHVFVRDEPIVEVSDVPDPLAGTWTGRIELRSGDEAGTFLMASEHVMGEAFLGGHFEPARPERVSWARNAGFFRFPEIQEPELPELARPYVRLQARAGAGGGNPNRVDVSGESNFRIDERSEHPLDLDTPVAMDEPSVAYVEAGRVPEGRVFVVTRVDYRGSARGDTNGRGELRIVLAGQEIAAFEDEAAPIQGAWTGRAAVLPGEESRTYLVIRNSSAAEAILTGHFEPRSPEDG